MTSDQLHARARQMALQHGITHSAALSILGKRGAFKRHANYGTLRIAQADRAAFRAVEQPARRYWWQDPESI